jgi:hypothetical protein
MMLRAMLAVAYATCQTGDRPDKKRFPGPPGWGFGVGLTNPHSKKLIVTKVEQRNKLEVLFDRPKPTADCSGRRRRRKGGRRRKEEEETY